MSKIYDKYARKGDKQNSQFFEDYLPKIYDQRERAGIDDLLTTMLAVLVQIAHGEAQKYMMELYLMTPYRLKKVFRNSTHLIYLLEVKPEFPRMILMEPHSDQYFDRFCALGYQHPRAKEKLQARYLGEIYHTKNLSETVKILEDHHIRFLGNPQNALLANANFAFTEPSYFTNNIIGYTAGSFNELDALNLGEEMPISNEMSENLKKAHDAHLHFGFEKLVRGIDHMATRVLCHSREDAILEFLVMTNYYFWGAYNIEDMNSSTNVTRNPNINDELISPAKVFTANNNPFYVGNIDKLPSPTEDFVRNFGRRMHHLAYEVNDGSQADGTKNIDYVVSKLIEERIPFLAQVIGECKDFPDLKQIFSKTSDYSLLITEYVQRCHGFQGFFTKQNVASLTQAAGEDEKLRKADIYD